MKKLKEKIISLSLALMLMGIVMQPVAAWGILTHEAITSQLKGVPVSVTSNPGYTKGGGVGPDMFYFLPGKEYYSDWAHFQRTADLPREMLRLAATDKQKAAYAYGWLSHCASDITGHRDYVNIKVSDPTNSNPPLHRDVEIGVDANLVDVTGSTFYVPYGLVQAAYKNIYGNAPWQITIYSAAQAEQAALYVEKAAIKAGAYNDLKNTYNDFWDVYYNSISYSESVINNPSTLPNANLDTGQLLTSLMVSSTSVSSSSNKANHGKIDPDTHNTADELLRNGVIEVPVQDDKINKVLLVGEPVIKDKKSFDDAIKKLVKIKQGKK